MPVPITIDADAIAGDCPHFWNAIGCDEAFAWTLHPSGDALLADIKRTGAIKWIRNHHVFSSPINLPDGREVWVYNEDDAGHVTYDFAGVDAVYDRWLAAGVRPIVELDFLPPKLRDPKTKKFPLNTPEMWRNWAAPLRAFISHLQARYGVEETRAWYFEIWNEPDLWPRDRIGELFRIHDEAVAAIEAVDPHLRIGGCAAAALPIMDQYLQQVSFGQNTLDPTKTGSRVDYLSLHQYGVSGNTLPWYPAMIPRPQDIVSRAYWLYELLPLFPGMREKEFHLNEWGMISHYEKSRYAHPQVDIRNSEHFPLFMFKLVHMLFTMADYRGNWLPTIMLLWAGACEAYWADVPEQRQKRYGDRSGMFAGNRSLTTAHNIAKPILRGFELLAKLGATRLEASAGKCGESPAVLATHGGGAIQVLLYHFDENPATERAGERVEISIEKLTVDGPAEVTVTRIDRAHANAYRTWMKMGEPELPSDEQIAQLHDASKLETSAPERVTIDGGRLTLVLDVPFPSAVLVMVRPTHGAFAAPTTPVVRKNFKHRIA